jgi:hypothetical protein
MLELRVAWNGTVLDFWPVSSQIVVRENLWVRGVAGLVDKEAVTVHIVIIIFQRRKYIWFT